ncbi:MAG: class I SAM-dependent methyltransferase [Acidobacteriia bacterium]|nr:class I SAM-dependent methyltransferase [Terriglobia bacterium]
MPQNPLRDAWTSAIRAEDYEAHMAAIGQAQANATLVADYFRARPPQPDATVLFAGAGAGQMFDFVSPSFLLPYRITFADINPGYLERLSARLAGVSGLRFTTVVDDVEQSKLSPGFELILAVLVLEHVDWRKAVATFCALTAGSIFIVTQENPANAPTSMTETRAIPGTMNVFKQIHSQLISPDEIVAEFARHDFQLEYSAKRMVADEKKMAALGFQRKP